MNLAPCRVCERVPPGDLLELDALMGDSSHWPKSVWGQFEPPPGPLTTSFRRFGAVEMGLALLRSKGIDSDQINRGHMRRHYRFDVQIVAITPADFLAIALEQTADHRSVVVPQTVDPLDYLNYYAQGINLGIAGLRLLQARIDKLVKADQEVPLAMLKMTVELGAKLATSQASIRAAGKPWGDTDDGEEGFRAGAEPLPSPRMGHARVRTIEGESRPVRDEGPADRADFNRRAREEGSPVLPGE